MTTPEAIHGLLADLYALVAAQRQEIESLRQQLHLFAARNRPLTAG